MSSKAKRIGQYIVLMNEKLGQGSSAQVFKGFHQLSFQQVAIKIIKKPQSHKNDEINTDDQDSYQIFKWLQEEIKIMRLFNSNQKGMQQRQKNLNLLKLTDVIQSKNNYYLIIEYAEKGSLRSLLKKQQNQKNQKRFTQSQTLQIINQIINGFKALNQKNIVHRDIKPENIMIDKNNKILIGDFGYAKQVQEYQNFIIKNGQQIGSLAYMSPQIFSGQDYTEKCDIWSLGVMMYQMLTGKIPYRPNDGDLLKQIKRKKSTLWTSFKQNCNISLQTQGFIKKCLAYEQKDRFSWKQIFQNSLFLKQDKL